MSWMTGKSKLIPKSKKKSNSTTKISSSKSEMKIFKRRSQSFRKSSPWNKTKSSKWEKKSSQPADNHQKKSSTSHHQSPIKTAPVAKAVVKITKSSSNWSKISKRKITALDNKTCRSKRRSKVTCSKNKLPDWVTPSTVVGHPIMWTSKRGWNSKTWRTKSTQIHKEGTKTKILILKTSTNSTFPSAGKNKNVSQKKICHLSLWIYKLKESLENIKITKRSPMFL